MNQSKPEVDTCGFSTWNKSTKVFDPFKAVTMWFQVERYVHATKKAVVLSTFS